MKKGQTTLLIILGIVLLGILFFLSGYNSLVSVDTNVEQKWANVQTSYQRRADLIPNLIATVKAYTDYEGETLMEITKARASITTAKTPAELQDAGGNLNSALSRLLVVVENYPDLKANQNYLDLQVQLEGTENRINTERNYFNEAVKAYKNMVRKFPSNLLAGMFNFKEDKWQMFQAQETAQENPDVKKIFGDE